MEDGIWGPKTNTSIRWAQSKIGVKVDGLWGTNTEIAYQRYRSKGNTSTSVTIPDGNPLTRKGHTGTRVRQLQQALIKSGEKLTKYQDDGSFGTETQNALKSFQRKAGITVDGVYGPKSERALRRLISR